MVSRVTAKSARAKKRRKRKTVPMMATKEETERKEMTV